MNILYLKKLKEREKIFVNAENVFQKHPNKHIYNTDKTKNNE